MFCVKIVPNISQLEPIKQVRGIIKKEWEKISSSRELIKEVLAAGWELDRVNGSHHEKMTFPAIFFKDGDGIGVRFSDLDGCFTCADNYENALKNAEEALGGWILSQEDMGAEIPKPTPFEKVKTIHGEAIVIISAYPNLLREAEKNKSVNRTVRIPNWLNKLGMEAKVNLSSLLAGALRQKLGV